MAELYGSSSAWMLLDGYDLRIAKLKGASVLLRSEMEDTTGVGDSARERTPVGMKEYEVAIEGGLWNTDTLNSHTSLVDQVPTSPQTSARVFSIGFSGQTTGEDFFGTVGSYDVETDVVAERGSLTKVNSTHAVTGDGGWGKILQPLAAVTADSNTEASSIDNSASSADGGAGFLHVTAFSGFTGYLGKVTHSTDDISFSDLVSFTNVTAAPAAERIAVSGTVNRYLAADHDVTGTGSLTVFIGFVRS